MIAKLRGRVDQIGEDFAVIDVGGVGYLAFCGARTLANLAMGEAAELAIEKKYDYVICGHIHQPQQKVVETKNGKVTYLNSGDWVEHLTALEYQQNEWTIFEYAEKDFPATQTIEMKSPINVVTDEINFYINSLAAI